MIADDPSGINLQKTSISSTTKFVNSPNNLISSDTIQTQLISNSKNFKDDHTLRAIQDVEDPRIQGRKHILSPNKSDVGQLSTNKMNSMTSTFYKTNTSCFTGPETGRIPVKNYYHSQELDSIPQHIYNAKTHYELPQWKQSVSTWRRGTAAHKFPQSERFIMPSLPGKYLNTFEMGSTLRKRAASFGYGKKNDICTFKHNEKAITNTNEPRAKRFAEDQNQQKTKQSSQELSQNSQNSQFTRQLRSNSMNMRGSFIGGMEPGKTFGLSYEHYSKNYLQYASNIVYSSDFGRNKPGPDAYKVSQPIGQNKQCNSIHKRLRMFNEQQDMQVPPLTKYVVSEKQVTSSKFKGLKFSQTKRQIGKPLNNYPGPEYKIQRDFDDPLNLCPPNPFR